MTVFIYLSTLYRERLCKSDHRSDNHVLSGSRLTRQISPDQKRATKSVNLEKGGNYRAQNVSSNASYGPPSSLRNFGAPYGAKNSVLICFIVHRAIGTAFALNFCILYFFAKSYLSIGYLAFENINYYYAFCRRTRPITPERQKSPSPILRPVRCSTPVRVENGVLRTGAKRCVTPESTIMTDKTELDSQTSLPGISVRNKVRALRYRLTKAETDLSASKKLVTGMSHKYSQVKSRAKQERKEKLALVKCVGELENAMRMMSFSSMQMPGPPTAFPTQSFNPYSYMPSTTTVNENGKKEAESIESIEIPLYLQ